MPDQPRAEHAGFGSHCHCLDALQDVLAAARYVLDAEDAGWPGHSPLVRLRQAVEGAGGPLVDPAPSCPSVSGDDDHDQSATVGPENDKTPGAEHRGSSRQ